MNESNLRVTEGLLLSFSVTLFFYGLYSSFGEMCLSVFDKIFKIMNF